MRICSDLLVFLTAVKIVTAANQKRRSLRTWIADPRDEQNLHAAGFDLQAPAGLAPPPWPLAISLDRYGDHMSSRPTRAPEHIGKVFSLTAEHQQLAGETFDFQMPFSIRDYSAMSFFAHHRQSLILSFCILGVVLMICGWQWRCRTKSKETSSSSDAGNLDKAIATNGDKHQSWDAWHAVFKLLYLWMNDPDCKWRARGLVLLVAVHWIMREAAWALVISRVDADAINSITSLHETKNVALVKHTLLVALAWKVCLGLPMFHLLDPWVSTWFQVSFQRHCTSKLLTAYFEGGGHAFYRIKMKETENGIDNPDQRIGQDIEQIADQIYQLYSAILSAVFGCTMWAVVIVGLGGPILLVIASVMSVLRLAISYGYFGNRLVVAYQDVLLTAADFRYGLTRVRENAEGVALSSGQALEKRRATGVFNKHIDAVVHNTWENMLYHSVMGFLAHFPSLILWMFQLSAILAGNLQIGDAIRVHQGYDQVSKVLDFLTSNFGTIMILQANAERLTQLWIACDAENDNLKVHSNVENRLQVVTKDDTAQHPNKPSQRIIFEVARTGEAFAICDLKVSAPGSNTLVGGVRVECGMGDGLLVSGCSGLGKSSVLRALAGLWLDGEGTVRRAEDAQIAYLPQSCYVPIGNLLDIVAYPQLVPEGKSQDLQQMERAATVALKKALLDSLLTRWGFHGESRDWAVVLSSGEKQRLAFARLFLQLELQANQEDFKGTIAILDESTSAVEVTMEESLYSSLRAYLGYGRLLGFASVGHRPTLPRFHDRELSIGHGSSPEAEEDLRLRILDEGSWRCPDGSQLSWQCRQLPSPQQISAQ